MTEPRARRRVPTIFLITQTGEHDEPEQADGNWLSVHTNETEAWIAFRAAENDETDTYLIAIEPPRWRVLAYGGPNQ